MLTLNRSLLNRKYNLMNVVKALVSSFLYVISMSLLYQRLHLGILHYLRMECSVHSM
jgi:hypothetical protein